MSDNNEIEAYSSQPIKRAIPYKDDSRARTEFFEIRKLGGKKLEIRATRSLDLLDLTFSIDGMGYDDRTNRLIKRSSVAYMTVTFPPQHIAETIHSKPVKEGKEDCSAAKQWPRSRLHPSGKSYVRFKINRPRKDLGGPLSIGALTNWAAFELQVDPRALSNIGNDALTQLEALFPREDLSGKSTPDLMARLGKAMKGLSEGSSSLELVDDLIFSPSERARWALPERPKSFAGKNTEILPLWSARLEGEGRRSLRAIHSRRLTDLPSGSPIPSSTDFREDEDISISALSMRNHWDIVAQTSLYGLPALLKLKGDDETTPDDKRELDAPPPSVVPSPLPRLKYLDHHNDLYWKEHHHRDVGLALARPFSDVDLSMTALGAVMDINWEGDPARLLLRNLDENGQILPDARKYESFNLERLKYRSWLGRDTKIEAVEKGFLLPLGIRASLMTVCERKVYANKTGQATSFEVRRKIIVIPPKMRRYPGPYQKHGGRGFPAQKFEMVTRVTPDLVNTRNILPDLAADSVFWPQVSTGGNQLDGEGVDFAFEWQTEDALAKSDLLFVINSVVGDPDLMAQIKDKYNESSTSRRMAHFGGARQRYAKPRKKDNDGLAGGTDGETSYDTNYWLLKAEGRLGPVGGGGDEPEDVFYMDGRMEGADQPPIYPVLEKANINIQAIDQMIGSAQGSVDVEFYGPYLRDDFADERPITPSRTRGGNKTSKPIQNNKADIFLTVIGGKVGLASGKQSQSTGGIASPQANVAALSRKIGMVGGNEKKSLAKGDTPYDFSDAAAGKFEPKKFLDGAKLLGVIDLGKLKGGISIDDAAVPQLKQVTEYGAGALEQFARAAAQEALLLFYGSNGLGGVSSSLTTAEKAIEKKLGDLGVELSFDDLIGPNLAQAIDDISYGSPPRLRAALEALKISADVKNVGAVISVGEDITGNIAAYIDDPVPELMEKGLQAIADLRGLIEGGINFDSMRAALKKLVIDYVKRSICTTIDSHVQNGGEPYGPILFGPYAYNDTGKLRTCNEIFARPALALAAMRDNLMGGALGTFVEAAYPYVLSASDLLVQAELEAERIEAGIDEAIKTMLIAVSDELKPLGEQKPDIRLDVHLEELRDNLTLGLKSIFDDLLGREERLRGGNPCEDLSRRIDFFEAKCHSLFLATLQSQMGKIPAIDADNLDQLLAKMADFLVDRYVKKAITGPLAKQVEQFKRAADGGARNIIIALEKMSDSLIALYHMSELPGHVATLNDLGQTARASALALLEKGLATVADIAAAAHELRVQAARLAGNSDWRLKQIGDRLVGAADSVLAALPELQTQISAAQNSLGDTGRELLNPLGTALQMRKQMLEEVRSALQFALADDSTALAAESDDLTGAIAKVLRALLPGTDPKQHDWDWGEITEIVTQLRKLPHVPDSVEAHAKQIEQLIVTIKTRSQKLASDLETPRNLAELEKLLSTDGATLLALIDRNLAGKFLQLTGFPDQLITHLKSKMEDALFAIWKVGPGSDISSLFDIMLKGLKDFKLLLAELKGDFPKTFAILSFVLGDKQTSKLTTLDNQVSNLITVVGDLKKIGEAPTVEDRIAAIGTLKNDGAGSIKARVDAFIKALQKVRIVDAGQAIAESIRGLLEQAEKELLALLRSFVPTKLTTQYDWKTPIGEFPRGESNAIYVPSRLSPNPPANLPEHDLALASTFSFDFLTKKATSKVVGTLSPFELRILTAPYRMATIKFAESTFTSVNGSKPKFDMDISGVELGPLLKFLEPLQAWLSPAGSGFYIKPSFDPVGVEAGYIYDAGIIQLGTLQFINVSFGVTAKLPFDGSSAKFGFLLGSSSRPFMVANPPYGGGGWVYLETDGQGGNLMELSIFFGGVSAIRFGPLDAQGRIVAGLYVRRDPNGSSLLMAYFEAVGSGSIACFSVSISLRVELIQANGGAMYGYTKYSFSFKCGFLKYKYRVQARYKINNGKSSRKLFSLQQIESGAIPTITVKLVDKSCRWNTYRSHFDTSLLVDG